MEEHWTILLDLDQTLVLTSALLPLRQQRNWQQVYASFHLTALPPGTQTFVQQARRFARLGVITTAPRAYAEKLLSYHHLNIQVIVAYHDTRLHKPDPAPILEAMRRLRASHEQCFYVGDTTEDILAAVGSQVVPIGLSWDGSLQDPQALSLAQAMCQSWGEVLTFIRNAIVAKE